MLSGLASGTAFLPGSWYPSYHVSLGLFSVVSVPVKRTAVFIDEGLTHRTSFNRGPRFYSGFEKQKGSYSAHFDFRSAGM